MLGAAWAVHLAGIRAGYAASVWLEPLIGAHALVVAVAVSALPGGVLGPAVLVLAPLAVWTGVLLPLALTRVDPGSAGRLLLADALGTLAAAGVLYLVALPLGLWKWPGLGLVVYVGAAALSGAAGRSSTVRP